MRSGSERSVFPRAYDGRTVGYIALGDRLRVVDTERDVGVSPSDVGVFCFRALWFGQRAYDGRTVGYIALGDGLRVGDTGRDVGVNPPGVGAFWFRALCLAEARTTVGPSATLRSVVHNV